MRLFLVSDTDPSADLDATEITARNHDEAAQIFVRRIDEPSFPYLLTVTSIDDADARSVDVDQVIVTRVRP